MEEKTTSTFSSIVCFHQTGTHHIQEGSDCEDVSVVIEQADFRFWGLADGQSEKEYCKTGGRAVLYAVAAHLQKKGLHTLAQHGYLDEVQYELNPSHPRQSDCPEQRIPGRPFGICIHAPCLCTGPCYTGVYRCASWRWQYPCT